LVSWVHEGKGGKKFAFQTTQGAAGGSILEAERIARLCWVKLNSGASKEDALEYRNRLYKKLESSSDMSPAKKRRSS